MKTRIPYSKPSITEVEVRYANDAAINGWGNHCYDYINRFEELFRQHLGVSYAIATSSCTGAIHMGMAALGIGLGDEVIMADTNWIASASPIVMLGAKPIFIDILEDSWCINSDLIEAAINSRTKAILAVHLYGNLCEMDKLLALGAKHGIPIIEDAAEAIGSIYHGNRAGAMGKFGVFSFHGTKTITTGEGGMFVTNDAKLYESVLTLSNHGRSKNQIKQFWPEVVGYKYKISNIQAAIGCGQLERIENLIKRKYEIFAYYREELKIVDDIALNPEPIGTINGAWMPTVVFDKKTRVTREKLEYAFASENIDARVFFYPLSSLSMFEKKPTNLVSWDIHNRAINLPSFHDITFNEQERIIKIIKEIINE
jgi:perosamine synthetase